MAIDYTYYDINKDGTNELIIVTNTLSDKYNIGEIYTYDGSKANMFINDDCLGERCRVAIYDNGIVYFYAFGGAKYYDLYFYSIGSDGYSREIISTYMVEIDENDNFIITDSNTKSKTDYSSDEEVISSVINGAKQVDLDKLEWNEIK